MFDLARITTLIIGFSYKILISIIILGLAFLAKTLVNKFIVNKIVKKLENQNIEGKAKTVISIIDNILNIVIIFIAVVLILQNFGINVASILAVAGVGGVAIAFASQSVIADIITGSFILVEDQFNVGDFVVVDATEGTVKKMGIRTTVLEDINGREIILPNSTIKKVINNSLNNMSANVTVVISSEVSYEKAETSIKNAIKECFENDGFYIEEPQVLGISNILSSGYEVLITGKSQNGNQWNAQRALRKRIIENLQKDSITFSKI